MKRMILNFVIILSPLLLYSQTASAVSVISDSINTTTYYIEQLNTMAEQVARTIKMLEHQAKVIECLNEGNFNEFVEAMEYQTESLSDFMELAESLNAWEDFEELQESINEEDYDILMQQTQELHEAMGTATEFMHRTQNLLHNSEYRLQAQDNLDTLSRDTDSVSGQLQITQQSLALIQGELQDVKICLTSLNTFLATQKKEEELQEQINNERANKYMQSVGQFYEPEVNEEFLSAIYGDF